MRNGEHYLDPTAGKALRKCRVAHEADLERMDSLRYVPRIENISEQDEQIAVMTWANMSLRKYPALKWLFHIPNGGSRHPAEALNLKRMGVKPGVPDLFLPFPSMKYSGLWIEMKSMTGRPTACQTEWMEHLEAGNRL